MLTYEVSGVPLEEALEKWMGELDFQKVALPTPAQEIPAEDSIGRITAKPVFACAPYPNYYAAAIDGMAIKSSLTFAAGPEKPVQLTVGQDVIFVAVGSPMTEGFDSVVSLENLRLTSVNQVEVTTPVFPWVNVKPVGEDVGLQDVILPKGHKIKALDIGVMLQGGVEKVKVRTSPKVAILAVGSNLVPPGCVPKAGEMIESHSHILEHLIRELGGDPYHAKITPEKKGFLKPLIKELVQSYDLILLLGGPSRGTGLLAEIIAEIGEVAIYGVEVKPGQSVLLGTVDKKAVVGLPWYPVSCFMAFELFVKPVLARFLGCEFPSRTKLTAKLARDVASPQGLAEFLRVEMGKVGGDYVAVPISRGAGVLMSLAKADGLLKVAAETVALSAGNRVEIELLNPIETAERKLLICGTHDIQLDILRSEYERMYPGLFMTSANIGSIAGLLALKSGLCHLSGIHVFDPQSGEFNAPFIKKFLPEMEVFLLNLFCRQLGFIVKKGNPKNIKDFNDLTRSDVAFVNRAKTSGTRSVQDYYLKKLNIPIEKIKGYEQEALTHMSLALAVAGEGADVGVGIYMAAKALDLDFVPLVVESFDLVIPKKFYGSFLVKCLLGVINSSEYQEKVKNLHGYEFKRLGEITKIG